MRKPIHKPIKYTDLKDMLKKTGEMYADRPAYMFKTEKEGVFKEITHKEFREDINALGTKLIEMGLKDKRIAVISENRYEWGIVYLAVVTGAGVIVPLDKSLPDNEIENLIIRSEVEAIFYSKKYDNIMKQIKEKNNTKIKYFISMDLEKEENEVYSEYELIAEGKKLVSNGNKEFLNFLLKPNIEKNEEHRVYYVALSRVKKRLFLYLDDLEISNEKTIRDTYGIKVERICSNNKDFR